LSNMILQELGPVVTCNSKQAVIRCRTVVVLLLYCEGTLVLVLIDIVRYRPVSLRPDGLPHLLNVGHIDFTRRIGVVAI